MADDEPNTTETMAPKPPMQPPKIPLTFDRWFWTSDYRKGITTLFAKLNAGLRESDELIAFIRARASHERLYADELRQPLSDPLDPQGFGYDDGAALLSAYRQIRAGQAELAEGHAKVARQLEKLVIGPFESWSIGHEERIRTSMAQVESILSHWEKQAKEVAKLKERYTQKSIQADEAADEARFAPAHLSPPLPGPQRRSSSPDPADPIEEDETLLGPNGAPKGDSYANLGKQLGESAVGLGRALSGRMRVGGGRVGFRATSMEKRRNSTDVNEERATLEPIDTSAANDAEREPMASPLEITPHSAEEKGKGKAILPPAENKQLSQTVPETKESMFVGGADLQAASNPGGIQLLDIAGVVRSPYDWSRLFAKARDTVYKQNVKVPLLGTYEGAQDGESLMIFFKREVPELEGSTERATVFCRELSEELAVLRLIGEIGNKFMASQDAFYLWKPEAFKLHSVATGFTSPSDLDGPFTALPERHSPRVHSPRSGSPIPGSERPRSASPAAKGAPFRSALLRAQANMQSIAAADSPKKTGAWGKYLQSAVKGINELTASAVTASTGEFRVERLHREAAEAEKLYANFVGHLDRTRLRLEEAISEHSAFLQRCELDRLRAAKAVLLGYNAAVASIVPIINRNAETSSVMQVAFTPEADIGALVERWRTGPFRPQPTVFQCHYGETVNVAFGIDLVRWFEGQDVTKGAIKEVPEVLTALLGQLGPLYDGIESHAERRKCWIYDVPLRATHAVREILNDPSKPIPSDALAQMDPPLLAATVKLWLLELDPSPVVASRYDDVKAIYTAADTSPEARIEVVKATLGRLPKAHLSVINAFISHLKELIDSTRTEEEDDVFLMKLGLSTSSALLRPPAENAVTLSDRFQPLFLMDLLKHYDAILPPAIEHKKQHEAERLKPKRQRTRPIDMRVRRSALRTQGPLPGETAKEILQQQQRRQSGSRSSTSSVPPVSAIPSSVQAPVDNPVASEAVESETEARASEPPAEAASPVAPLSPTPPPPERKDPPFVPPEPRDPPFVPPEPKDPPFIPPTSSHGSAVNVDADASLVSTLKPPSPPYTAGSASPDQTYEDAPLASSTDAERAVHSPVSDPEPNQETVTAACDDVPLAPAASLQRNQSSGLGASLSRSSGVRGPRTSGPRGPRTSVATGSGSVSHRKGTSSIDTLRAQFEPKPENVSASDYKGRKGHRINAGAFGSGSGRPTKEEAGGRRTSWTRTVPEEPQ